MEIKSCPINDIDFYVEYGCDFQDQISYKNCYKCANGFLKELKDFIKQLKKEKNNGNR